MYNLLANFFSGVNFWTDPAFFKKNRSAVPAKNFRGQNVYGNFCATHFRDPKFRILFLPERLRAEARRGRSHYRASLQYLHNYYRKTMGPTGFEPVTSSV